jgi:hypothetical protein
VVWSICFSYDSLSWFSLRMHIFFII